MLSILLAAALSAPAPTGEDSPDYQSAMAHLADVEGQLDLNRRWDDHARALAMDVSKAHMMKWMICVAKNKFRYAQSHETPDDIATAVLGACFDDHNATQKALTRISFGLVPLSTCQTQAEQLANNFEAEQRKVVISYIVDVRLPKPAATPAAKGRHH